MVCRSSLFRTLACGSSIQELFGSLWSSFPHNYFSTTSISSSTTSNISSSWSIFVAGEDVVEQDHSASTSSSEDSGKNNTTSAVLELTDDNFLETVSTGKEPIFVKFYAPWCGHCKNLAPEWENLAKSTQHTKGENACTVARLDATKHRGAAEKMKIRGYPSLYLFGKEQMYEYGGKRQLSDMKTFCEGGYLSATARNFPWNETFVDQVKDFAEEYVRKVSQIVAFEPTILPLMFLLGVLSTVFVYFVVQYTSPKPRTKGKKSSEAASPKKQEKAE